MYAVSSHDSAHPAHFLVSADGRSVINIKRAEASIQWLSSVMDPATENDPPQLQYGNKPASSTMSFDVKTGA